MNDRLNIADRKLWISYFVQNCISVPAFLQSHACSLLHNNPLLLPSNHITHRSLRGLYRRTSQSPQRLTLKMAPVIFVDTLKNIQHCTQLIPESRSYTYRNSMLNFVHICACWLHFLQVAKNTISSGFDKPVYRPISLTTEPYHSKNIWRVNGLKNILLSCICRSQWQVIDRRSGQEAQDCKTDFAATRRLTEKKFNIWVFESILLSILQTSHNSPLHEFGSLIQIKN